MDQSLVTTSRTTTRDNTTINSPAAADIMEPLSYILLLETVRLLQVELRLFIGV